MNNKDRVKGEDRKKLIAFLRRYPDKSENYINECYFIPGLNKLAQIGKVLKLLVGRRSIKKISIELSVENYIIIDRLERGLKRIKEYFLENNINYQD